MSWQYCVGCGEAFSTGVNHALCPDCRDRDLKHPIGSAALDYFDMDCLYCATIKRDYP